MILNITVTFKSGRFITFTISSVIFAELISKMTNAISQIQLLTFDQMVINLYEVESIVAIEKKEQNDDTKT